MTTTASVMLPMILGNSLLLLQEIEAPPRLSSDDWNWATVIGQSVLLVTTIAGFLYTIYRENRNRRWDLEDRERARVDLERKVVSSQRELAVTAQASHDVLMEKIDENTDISKRAFHEANDVNQKIASLSKAIDSVRGSREGGR